MAKRIIKRRKKHNWVELLEFWITNNLDKKYQSHHGYTLSQMSKDKEIEYHTLVKHASVYKWREELLARQVAKEHPAIAKALVTPETQAIEILKRQDLNDEVIVRQRHAALGRNLQNIAYKKLKTIKPEDLSTRDAIKMLELGVNQERAALGITLGDLPTTDTSMKEFNLVDAMQVMNDIVPLLKGKDGVYDVESEEVVDGNPKQKRNSKSSKR